MKVFNYCLYAGICLVLVLGPFAGCATHSGNTLQQGTTSLAAKPKLGVAENWAIYGALGIANQGVLSAVDGDIGTKGVSGLITGFHDPKQSFTETVSNNAPVAGTVIADLPQGSASTLAAATAMAADSLVIFKDLASRPNGVDPGNGQLGGLSLTSGVYTAAKGSFTLLDSDLVLDAQGNPDSIWIFQMKDSLTVGARLDSRSVILVNGARAGNVYWQVGKTAAINPRGGGIMVGTIIARDGITISTPGNVIISKLKGRAISLNAGVAIVNTVVSGKANGGASGPSVIVTGTTASDVDTELNGNGFITIKNNGGHVSTTQAGTGTLAVTNNGGKLTARNTGNGSMIVTSNATGEVTIVNNGNGKVTINATGAAPIGINHIGDEDFVYP